ncbi:hypothetical protein CYY_010038 [Polysphondylium violaceum]|uniref:FZ domain-containing protein n=1 Tax=Polysphondylium violaceum TaxID=133409 RepID=A0A8J4PSH9_9MYCE|nr:hypothetical protein CYY_010038 [Polysphondylium violaceum]
MASNIFILFIIVSLSFTGSLVYSQESSLPYCEPYQPNSLCNDYLPYKSIFIQDKNTTQQDLYVEVYKQLSYLDESKCNIEVALKFLCTSYFQECIKVVDDLELPNRPCESKCIDVVKECPMIYQGKINCKEDRVQTFSTATGDIFKYPYHANLWNIVNQTSGLVKANIECDTAALTVITADGGEFKFPTNGGVTGSKNVDSLNQSSDEELIDILTSLSFCPPPLLFRNSTDRAYDAQIGYRFIGDTPCIFDCPSPFYSKAQWNKFDKMVKVVGIISFCTSLIVIVTYGIGLYVQRDQRHTISILCIAFGIFLIMLTDVVYAGTGFEMVCPDRGRYARQHDKGCSSTGLIFQFGCVIAVISWSVFSFDLWLSLKKIKGVKNLKYYYLVGISILSILLTFIPVAGDQYGYGFSGLGCWILDFKWQLIFFWVPLSICLLVGTTFIVLILFEIKTIVSASNQKRKKTILKYHLKPLLAIIFICAEFFYILIYNSYIQSKSKVFERKIEDYVVCLMMGMLDPTLTCTLETVSFPSTFTFLFFLRLLGIEAMVFFVWSTQSRKIWSQTIFFKKIGVLKGFLKKSSKESSVSSYASGSTSPNTFQMTPTATFRSQDDSGLGDSGDKEMFKLDTFRLDDSQERLTSNILLSNTNTATNENNNENITEASNINESSVPNSTSDNNSSIINNSIENSNLNQVITINDDLNNNNNDNDNDNNDNNNGNTDQDSV